MTTDKSKIKYEKLQYDINAKIYALSSTKIGKYEYLTGEIMLPSNWSKIIELAKFAYSSLGKALENQTKKQVDVLKSFNLCKK